MQQLASTSKRVALDFVFAQPVVIRRRRASSSALCQAECKDNKIRKTQPETRKKKKDQKWLDPIG